jgi:hypothetical protein
LGGFQPGIIARLALCSLLGWAISEIDDRARDWSGSIHFGFVRKAETNPCLRMIFVNLILRHRLNSFSAWPPNTWVVFSIPQEVLGSKRLEKMEHKRRKP